MISELTLINRIHRFFFNRRVLRQIVQCIRPIADVMILLFFMVAVFALAGQYIIMYCSTSCIAFCVYMCVPICT